VIKGFVEIYDIIGGIWYKRAEFDNNIMNTGYDAFARAVAGDSTYSVNGMYVQYYNGTPTDPDPIPLTRTPSYFAGLSGDHGYLRLSTLSNPTYSATQSKYVGNKATFLAVSDGTNSNGATVIDGTTQFYVLGLVAIPDIDTQTSDHLISMASIKDTGGSFSPITKIANSQVGFKWSVKFGD